MSYQSPLPDFPHPLENPNLEGFAQYMTDIISAIHFSDLYIIVAFEAKLLAVVANSSLPKLHLHRVFDILRTDNLSVMSVEVEHEVPN